MVLKHQVLTQFTSQSPIRCSNRSSVPLYTHSFTQAVRVDRLSHTIPVVPVPLGPYEKQKANTSVRPVKISISIIPFSNHMYITTTLFSCADRFTCMKCYVFFALPYCDDVIYWTMIYILLRNRTHFVCLQSDALYESLPLCPFRAVRLDPRVRVTSYDTRVS